MGTDILFEVSAYIVKQILLKIGHSVMASLIEVFRVESHTATFFFDDGTKGFKIVALFA